MQFKYNAKQKLESFPVLIPQFVDKRRKIKGVASLKVYLKRKINYGWIVKQECCFLSNFLEQTLFIGLYDLFLFSIHYIIILMLLFKKFS